jgi:hypothetical protein
MVEALLTLLVLLQIKHWYIDFVNQSMAEVHSKGIYGDLAGINHSAKQAIGTMIAILFVTGIDYIAYAGVLAFIDFVCHYHIDWAKININKKKNYTVEHPEFWMWLGFDQLLHQLTYLFIIWMVFV